MRHPISLIAATLVTVTLASCGGIEPPGEPLIYTPKVGASFTYVNYTKDSTGARIPSSQTYSTRSIIGTNASVLGRTGVVQYAEGADTFNMHFSSNGDVAFLQPAVSYPGEGLPLIPGLPSVTVPARWVQFGFGSKTTQTVPGLDTSITVSVPGVPLPIPVNIKVTGNTAVLAGTETVAVGGESISAQKGVLTVTATFSAILIGSAKVTTVDTVYFAPKLGMFIKDESLVTSELPAQLGPSGITGGASSALTGYTAQ